MLSSAVLSIFSLLALGVSVSSASPGSDHMEIRRKAAAAKVPIYDNCKVKGTVAFTMDDGPYIYSKSIEDTLAKTKAVGNFFVNGNNYDCIYNYADDLKHKIALGHFIGSHTWSHADLATLGRSELVQQFSLVEDAFRKILGIRPLYFRPPYGSYNDLVLQVAAERGYKGAILWDYDSGDSADNPPSASQEITAYNKLSKSYPSPHLALNHDVYKITSIDVLPKVVPTFQKAGYKVVSIPECLGLSADPSTWYVKVGSPQAKDSTWNCNPPLPQPGDN